MSRHAGNVALGPDNLNLEKPAMIALVANQEASTSTPRQTCGTGFGEFEFGTASRACARSSLAIFTSCAFSEVSTLMPYWACGSGFGKT